MSGTIEIKEKDKPFILALVASGITILNLVFAAVGAYIGNKDMMAESVDAMKYTFTLTASAWAFYFGKPKSSQ
jgi:uncharacterized protein (DUF486 family)